jgi:hypothetical protein
MVINIDGDTIQLVRALPYIPFPGPSNNPRAYPLDHLTPDLQLAQILLALTLSLPMGSQCLRRPLNYRNLRPTYGVVFCISSVEETVTRISSRCKVYHSTVHLSPPYFTANYSFALGIQAPQHRKRTANSQLADISSL